MNAQKFSRPSCAVLGLVLATTLAHAQTYPIKQVRFVVGFPAGGATDVVARTISQNLSESLSINPSLYKKLPYNALKDFAAVSQVTDTPFMFVTHPSLPVKNVKEFIALAKAKPGQLNYGSAGNGSGGHLFTAMFGSMAGIKLVHVPYRGASFATTSV